MQLSKLHNAEKSDVIPINARDRQIKQRVRIYKNCFLKYGYFRCADYYGKTPCELAEYPEIVERCWLLWMLKTKAPNFVYAKKHITPLEEKLNAHHATKS